MSFADIINQTQKQLESQTGGGDKVAYPETKHKRLFFAKNERELLIQVLPSADLVSAFSVGARKIFLSAKSSQGKDINSNFTLDADANPGSILEQKITEWSTKGMIPNGFGGQQSPKRVYLVNVVKIVQINGQWVQERDEQGNLAVRVFEMPQSGFQNVIRKLQDPLYNVSQSELSFMDPNKPSPIKISKPAKGQMEYPVEVYTSIVLPPLGQGWEHQLEDLNAQAVPTERLENGLQWVQAFIDMKEGRKPNSQGNGQDQGAPQAQANPYAQQQQQQQTQVNPYAQQQANPYAQQQQPNPYAQQQQYQAPPAQQQYQAPPAVDPYAQQQQTQVNPYQQQQSTPAAAPGMVQDALPESFNVDAGLSNLPPATNAGPQQTQAPAQNQIPTAPQQTQTQTPPPATAPQADLGQPSHAVNNNGLMDIDAMLEKELNGGN